MVTDEELQLLKKIGRSGGVIASSLTEAELATLDVLILTCISRLIQIKHNTKPK